MFSDCRVYDSLGDTVTVRAVRLALSEGTQFVGT